MSIRNLRNLRRLFLTLAEEPGAFRSRAEAPRTEKMKSTESSESSNGSQEPKSTSTQESKNSSAPQEKPTHYKYSRLANRNPQENYWVYSSTYVNINGYEDFRQRIDTSYPFLEVQKEGEMLRRENEADGSNKKPEEQKEARRDESNNVTKESKENKDVKEGKDKEIKDKEGQKIEQTVEKGKVEDRMHLIEELDREFDRVFEEMERDFNREFRGFGDLREFGYGFDKDPFVRRFFLQDPFLRSRRWLDDPFSRSGFLLEAEEEGARARFRKEKGERKENVREKQENEEKSEQKSA